MFVDFTIVLKDAPLCCCLMLVAATGGSVRMPILEQLLCLGCHYVLEKNM
ncbi:hypothetical protein RND71_019336 [Anisodus tanguticus]|uniref:Uncharacterized protein n=1 Tax=Anisodus tanguticus TaxID=243964 RepID=A0AAE1VGC8_9SOLA|nr:hypothetical protein RND71_019336 [Anisodus tanguticus]